MTSPRVLVLIVILVACAPKERVESAAKPTPTPAPARPIPEATLPMGARALPARTPDPPGKAVATDLVVDAERTKAVRALLDELRAAIIKRDEAALANAFSGDEALPTILQQIVRLIGDRETKVRLVPLAPTGDGVWVRLVAAKELFAGAGDHSEIFAAPTEKGWRFFPTGPRGVVKAKLTHVKARVRVDPARHFLEGEAELTVENDGERFVAVDLDVATADPEETFPDANGYRLDAVEVDGKAAAFEVIARADVIVVEVDPAKPRTKLRFAWRGAPSGTINRLDADALLLHEAQPWIPVMPKTEAELDIVLEHPARFDVIAESATEISRERLRMRIARADRGTTLVGAPELVRKTVDLGGVKAIVALTPKRKERLDELAEATRLSLESMKILGALPSPELRIVESPVPPGVKALGGRSFLALGASGLTHQTIAHELAHSWFGGAVTTTYRGEWGGEWPESLAEYVVLWTLDDTRARKERRGWSECYGPLRTDDEGEVRSSRKSNAQSITLLYCKGPMIMAGLEARAGRDVVRRSLARFVADAKGEPASWEHVVAAVRAEAGAAHADWLADRLSRGRGPAITIEDLKRDGAKVTGAIVQRFGSHQPARFDERLALRFEDAEGKKTGDDVTIELKDRTTPLALDAPKDARRIVIDPDYLIPWKYSAPEARIVPLPRE